MQVEIHNAAADDCFDILELIKNELGYMNLDRDRFRARYDLMLLDAHIATFLAKKDGITLGFISLRKGLTFEIDGEYAQIIGLAVNSSFKTAELGRCCCGMLKNMQKLMISII